MENTAITERIKELRLKNEYCFKRIFIKKDKYTPAEIDINKKIAQEKNTTNLIRLIAFAIAVIFGFSVDIEKNGTAEIYKLLFLFLLFYMPSFITKFRQKRYEEIKFLKSVSEKI